MARDLGVAAAVIRDVQGLLDDEFDWQDMMQGWIVRSIAFGPTLEMRFASPPPDADTDTRANVARSLSTLLKFRSTELDPAQALGIVRLLLALTTSPDPEALAAAVSAHPRLLTDLPQLWDIHLYDGSDAAVMMIYLALSTARGKGTKSALRDLYEGLRRQARYSPDVDGIGASEEVLSVLIARLAAGPTKPFS